MVSSLCVVCNLLQVIEKAYKKLRLDALVIQQGRLTENQGAKVRRHTCQQCPQLRLTS